MVLAWILENMYRYGAIGIGRSRYIDPARRPTRRSMWRPRRAGALASFLPVIARVPPSLPRLVVHAKFGRGRVLREHDDQLEIDFGANGVRTILARFVTRE